ncbi:MAG: TIGR02302 family protein [Alphaproteobacteria bacterium]|nr:TIGR02302 family protein [Alphaproteobacteria bacterium]MDE2495685.1 TIGR02302 family protein [Alphaproteobacteria bacterium]
MTRYSQPTEFPAGSKPRRFARLILASRAALAWERLWPKLWPANGIVGLGIAAALFDVLPPLPWPLHALILAGIVTAVGLALYFNLTKFSWPNWLDAARRLERDSFLQHRPISEAQDVLAAGVGDTFAEELWRAHLLARLQGIGRIRLSWPRSDLGRRDPRALRFVVLLLIVFGAFVAGSDWSRRLAAALGPAAGTSATLDAWIDPPVYTGEAPIYLSKSGSHIISVPQGSILNLRVHGADHLPSATLSGVRFEGDDGEYSSQAKLTDPIHLRVRADGRTIGSWKVAIIADQKPTIAFAAPPAVTDRQALQLSYKASDDYGVVAARAVIRPHGRSGAPIVIDLQLPGRSAKSVSETVYRDLTEHPYAGLDVDITLLAVDAAGQTGASNTVRFKLPERIFTDPLARALIEQRQLIASMGASSRGRVLATLNALSIAPDKFYAGQEGTYLALRAAYWGLKYAADRDDFERIEDLLWQTAIGLERSGLLKMAEQLRQMQQQISQMMAGGAPQSDIDAMLQRYNDLMQRYLQALAQNAPQNAGPPDANAKVLGEQDLAALLKAIQDLSRSGDRLKAMQLLAFLEGLVENMQVANGSGSGGSAADNEALRNLGELMGKQRMLMDKTFRQSQGTGDPKDGGPKGLARQQGQLHDELGTILKDDGKAPGARDLEEAGRIMGDAQQALNLGDLGRAGTLQKDALDALRKGANAIAGTRQGMGAQSGQDPFGRAVGNRGAGPGGNLKIPDASVLQRARDILKELRKRAGELGRSKEELDYIDRLLQQF